MQVLKKITPKTVYGKIIAADVVKYYTEHQKAKPLFMLIGRAESIIVRDSPYPDEDGNKSSVGFKGKFRAENDRGDRFLSDYMFAPAIVTATLKEALSGDDAENVEFAFAVGAVPGAKDPDNKYEFTVTPLVEIAITDPLAALAEKVQARLLEAPKAKAKR